MAKYMCVERCFDSTKSVSYYENTVYDLGKSDVEHLKKIGQFKRFEPLEDGKPEKAEKPEDKKVPADQGKDKKVPADQGKDKSRRPFAGGFGKSSKGRE